MRGRHVDLRAGRVRDHGARPGAGVGDRLDAVGDGAIDGADRGLPHDRDTVVRHRGVARAGQLESPGLGVEAVGASHHVERGRQIFGAARHGSDHEDVEWLGITRKVVARRGQDAEGRLVPVDAAVVRRIADRRADVAPRLEGGKTGREGGGRAAGRPSGRARDVPGVVRRAVHDVVGLPVHQPERHVGGAEQDGARIEETVDHDGVLLRDVRREVGVAPRHAQAGDAEGLLDRHRHAVKRPPGLALRQRVVGPARAFAGAPPGRARQWR